MAVKEYRSNVFSMALRELIYYVDIIKPMVMNTDLYSRRPVLIPTPHFCVFYNGNEKRPREELFYLSGLFEKYVSRPELEVCCRVININRDVNPEFLNRCKVLNEYAVFIDMVNENRIKGQPYKEAVETAIRKCILENVLKDFLMTRGNEVLEVMTLDYTWERREELIRRDERAEGRIEGYTEGVLQSRLTMICKKLKKGKSISVISDELEEDMETVQKYVDIASKYAPEYDVEKIMEEIKEGDCFLPNK